MQNYLDCGEAIVQGFRCLGIDYVMASPGSEWGSVWEAFARQKVSNAPGPVYLSCAHETLAVDLAIGYTVMTGRMQGVMLHTGVGLLQGAMGIDAASRQGIPMIVMSGESLTYGERADGFDPGAQWQGSLSVVGGPHRIAEPLVKWSATAASPSTLFEQMIRAGEMAQRTPTGPVFMTMPIETMLSEWHRPDQLRTVPPAPKLRPSAADVERVADRLAKAKLPVILVEGAGRDPEAYHALVALAELLSIPVAEPRAANYCNFPMDNPLWQGHGRPPFLDEADLVLTIDCAAPWYPPKSRPARAHVIAIGQSPLQPYMVYQNLQADEFLEGDTASTLRLIAEAVASNGLDAAKAAERKEYLATAHAKVVEEAREAEKAARAKKGAIDPIALFATMRDTLPKDAIYADETITHRGRLKGHAPYSGPQSYFRVYGGLGQGLGVALGLKLAAKDRPVVAVLGDGSFLYNPITQALAISKYAELPILAVVANNHGYTAMMNEHAAFYPDGVSVKNNIFLGRDITEIDYAELTGPFGGYGRRVDKLAELPAALEEGMASVKDGKTAIINVMVEN